MPSKNGLVNVILGFKNFEDRLSDNPFFGSTVGRVANRVRDAKFKIGKKEFHVSKNHGNHQLHGGFQVIKVSSKYC